MHVYNVHIDLSVYIYTYILSRNGRGGGRSFSGSLSPSLAAYLYLWQSLARAEPHADLTPLFDVLNITDAKQINALFHNGR